MSDFLHTKIEFLKGIGPQRASLLNTEFQIFTYEDLLQYYPYRYEDRSKFYKISEAHEDMPFIQIKGRIKDVALVGKDIKKRLTATFHDETGVIDLVWFQGINFVSKSIKPNVDYIVFGKPTLYGSKINIAHPEIEILTEANLSKGLEPFYNTSEKAKRKSLDSKMIARFQKTLADIIGNHLQESLPGHIINKNELLPIKEALLNIHFPKNLHWLERAQKRLKFEELFYVQLRLLKTRNTRKTDQKGFIFKNIPTLNDFYKNHLPFDLTNAQKRVIREIYKDLCSGKQMNRLLQGDVGSGKTIVAFICMLMAIDNGCQACIMAPTEILANQHYKGLKEFADKLNLPISILTGSSKKSERDIIHENLFSGELKIIVGTHALLEDPVKFNNLGLVIIDEQHRFGVAQRAKLWNKNKILRPHILVMTATPIPRTLAMTLYGDLDMSVIDELPVGRKPIKTEHKTDRHRIEVFGFIRKQIQLGRQIYIVYPLIEESEKLDLKDLMDGYESICRAFPEYQTQISMLHGRQTSVEKENNMKDFVDNRSKIMVATTVIEVGVNVPNASVMVIENAERFGLSQLHQLRGRVGRGADQSYCILMTGDKLSKDSRTRIQTMVKTNNGFEIADVDLRLRGPGDLAGTQQSGVLDLKIADLSQDAVLVHNTRQIAEELLEVDPNFENPENVAVKRYMENYHKSRVNWSKIS